MKILQELEDDQTKEDQAKEVGKLPSTSSQYSAWIDKKIKKIVYDAFGVELPRSSQQLAAQQQELQPKPEDDRS